MSRKTIYGVIIASISIVVGGGLFIHESFFSPRPEETMVISGYHAVQLQNGNLYFGTLEGLETDFPILRNVCALQKQATTNNQPGNLVMVLREKQEMYAPGYMRLQSEHIVFVEPVEPTTEIAQTIDKLKQQGKITPSGK